MSQLTLDLYDELKMHFAELQTPKMLAEYLEPLMQKKISLAKRGEAERILDWYQNGDRTYFGARLMTHISMLEKEIND